MIRVTLIFYFVLFAGCLSFISRGVEAENESYEKLYFSIKKQTLDRSLLEFGLQSETNIVVLSDGLPSYVAPPIEGNYSARDALKSLLAESPFLYKYKRETNTFFLLLSEPSASDLGKGQDSASEDDVEEVLVVSARHFREAVYDVPMSIVSYQGDQLERRGTTDLVQLGAYSLNTTIKLIGGTSSVMTAFIRGIGQEDPLAGIETGVGIYIDDVYINRPQSVILDIYDAERIEILRGPQGVLYGHNTIGGALKYVTKRLSNTPELDIKLSMGSYEQRDLLLSGSVPLVEDTLFVGGSVAVFKRDGFGRNLTTGEEQYDKDVVALRSSVEFKPSDEIFIRLTSDITYNNSSAISGRRSDHDDFAGGVYDTYAGVTEREHPLNEAESRVRGASLTVEYQLNDYAKAQSISAHRYDRTQLPIDIDATPVSVQDLFILYKNEQSSQELRLLFDGTSVHAVAGFYFMRASSDSASDVASEVVGGILLTHSVVHKDVWAVFSSVDIDLAETFSISLGGRYTKDERIAEIVQNAYSPTSEGYYYSPQFGGDGIAPLLPEYDDSGNMIFPRFRGSLSADVFTPRISVSWEPRRDIHIYASYAAGFKSGGFDPRGNYLEESVREGFLGEEIDTYELGLKVKFREGDSYLNTALFYSDYKNKQVYGSTVLYLDKEHREIFINITSIENSPKSKVAGFEFELSMNLSDGYYADFSLGLIRSEFYDGFSYEEWVFQDAPETMIVFSPRYETDYFGGELVVLGAVNYRSQVYLSYSTTPEIAQPGYSLINASVTWASKNKKWKVGMHGINLSDKKYRSASFNFSGGLSSLFYGDPRTFTATLGYHF